MAGTDNGLTHLHSVPPTPALRCEHVEVVAPDSIVWVSVLQPGTSAQKVKLITLTQALKLAKGKIANIWTDN